MDTLASVPHSLISWVTMSLVFWGPDMSARSDKGDSQPTDQRMRSGTPSSHRARATECQMDRP